MSLETKDNMDVEVPEETNDAMEQDEDILDDYQIAFDDVEELESTVGPLEIIIKYNNLLNNERTDENATKIKENIIYK